MKGNIISLEGPVGSRPRVFACGADLKSRFSFLEGGRLHLSGDHGDLSEADNFAHFLASVGEMRDALGARPEIVAHDLHPRYFSSRAAALFPGSRPVGVQHHHAHIAGVMAVTGEEGPVIGVSFDGTGYGTDGNIWGGEFLEVSPEGCLRRGHLGYMKMPGGEMAVREPRRMAFALLHDRMGERAVELDLPVLDSAPRESFLYMARMMERGVNTPLTSSCGRLFDAVSSLLGITHVVRREAEAAVNLERAAAACDDGGGYRFEIERNGEEYVAGYGPLLSGIMSDLGGGVSVARIARRFHNSLAWLVGDMADLISRERGTRKVALSGGVFQNRLLHRLTRDVLESRGYGLLEGGDLPVNDLGISVGQTWVTIHSIIRI